MAHGDDASPPRDIPDWGAASPGFVLCGARAFRHPVARGRRCAEAQQLGEALQK
ncbi:MAG: hypothetical protein R3A44_03070 [Caldilineaceae bacterium]